MTYCCLKSPAFLVPFCPLCPRESIGLAVSVAVNFGQTRTRERNDNDPNANPRGLAIRFISPSTCTPTS
jgi:hypothetical protein